jgi:hypothetical protein
MLPRDVLKGRTRQRRHQSSSVSCATARLKRHRHPPNSIKNFLVYTLKRLGTDHVDIYRPACISPEVPIEDVVGTPPSWSGRLSATSACRSRRDIAAPPRLHPIPMQIEYHRSPAHRERSARPRVGVATAASFPAA